MTMSLIMSTGLEDAGQTAVHHERLASDVEVAFVTDRGGYEENQDCCGYARAADKSWAFCVADGLGGHRGGRVASRMAVKGALEAVTRTGFTFDDMNLLPLFKGAQQQIVDRKQKEPGLSGMRSTLVVLVIKDGLACWGHTGDVRLYHLRHGQVVFQTKDQSVPQMLVDMGEIHSHEIRGHPDRSRILHALGSENDRLRVVQTPGPVLLESNDVLHLSTDGFWEWIDEARLQTAMARGIELPVIQDGLVEDLRKKALKKEPEYDNYTALTVRMGNVRRNEAFRRKTRLVRPVKKTKP
jgi:PPM family protein phosphatase